MATCLRCGNEWTPRKEKPRKCPSCQNPNWNRPTKRKKKPVPKLRYEDDSRGKAQDVGGTPESGDIPSTTGSIPIEKDSLSDAKARAEALLRQLTA